MIHRLANEIRKPEDILSLTIKQHTSKSAQYKIARDLFSSDAREPAEKEWARACSLGINISDIQISDIQDSSYPALLRETCDPPVAPYLRNEGWDHRHPHIAVVGAKWASIYSINCAEQITRNLAELGIVIVSGLARGIDNAAHREALSQGSTVAVCSIGLDRFYSSENLSLGESIVVNGALLSEFPLGRPPLLTHISMRNRILAYMTIGTIVVESGERPRLLITSRLALEANRQGFAVPGPVFSAQSFGPRVLVREGACLIADWKEVVEELGKTILRGPDLSKGASSSDKPELLIPQNTVRDTLSASREAAIDILFSKLGLPRSEIYSAVLEQELAGHVGQFPWNRYVLSSA